MAKINKNEFGPVFASKKPARKPARRKGGSNALYVLIIMALLSVIAVMAVNYSQQKQVKTILGKNELPQTAKSDPDKTDDSTGKSGNPAASDDPPAVDTPKTEQVKIYDIIVDEQTEKAKYVPVVKSVGSDDPLRHAIDLLIKGPDSREEDRGMISALPDMVKVRSVKISGGIAVIDFTGEFSYNAIGDITIGRINQIYFTATQFRGVKGITLKMNGSVMNTIGGDGRVFRWPMTGKL